MSNKNLQILKNKVELKPSDWFEKEQLRKETQSYQMRSAKIAFKILDRLDDLKMNQSQLAEKMDVSRQVVSKWVKGKTNFTLETIAKLEETLDFKLIEVVAENKTHAKTIYNAPFIQLNKSYVENIFMEYQLGNSKLSVIHESSVAYYKTGKEKYGKTKKTTISVPFS